MKIIVLRNAIKANEEKPLFQLFFLKDDEYQSVEVTEAEEIDFKEVESRLRQGASVFITRKRKHELNATSGAKESASEPLYFTRI